jgi:hypothetical protein
MDFAATVMFAAIVLYLLTQFADKDGFRDGERARWDN